jgi:hypothetical protein
VRLVVILLAATLLPVLSARIAAAATLSFATHVDIVTGTDPYAVVVGDFRGTGRKDLAVTNWSSNTVSVLLSNGNGTFATKVDYTTGTNPNAAVLGDLRGNGRKDLIVADYGSATVSVFLSNGDGTFAAKVDYTTGTNPESVAVGDFNGDGHLDLAVANHGDATVSVFPGSGTGTFAAKVDYATGTRPNSVAVGDLNGDGKLDLAMANYASGTSGTTSVLLGNGDGTFGSKTDITTGLGPDWVAMGDFNGDGYLDFATANWTAGTVSVLLNTTPEPPAITSANNSTFTVGVAGTFTVTATGTPTVTLSKTGTLPSGVTFTDNGDSTATLAGTPTNSLAAGIYTLTITAHNTTGPDATQTFTLTVTPGTLAISVPSSTSLGSAAPSGSISAQLGTVQVTDARFITSDAWTATVSATSFTTGGGTGPETIATTSVKYWSGNFTSKTGLGTFTPGQLTASNAVVLSASRTAFTHTFGNLTSTASWTPTLVIAVPATAVAGTYSGTVTHSVA